MSYLGLVPSERSTGERVRRGGITKAGNSRARRVLVEGAWTYRHAARVGRVLLDIAWKAELRLCSPPSKASSRRQADDDGRHRDRRDGGFPLGDRS